MPTSRWPVEVEPCRWLGELAKPRRTGCRRQEAATAIKEEKKGKKNNKKEEKREKKNGLA